MLLADFESHRPLFLRANRALGTALVDHKLVTSEALDQANSHLLEVMKAGEFKQASLLGLLLAGSSNVEESAVIQYQTDTHDLGLINLTSYNLERSVAADLDLPACWATRTLPSERSEEFVLLATNFYLSEPVRKFWQDHFKGLQLIWSVASNTNLVESLERVEAKHKKAAV